MNQNTAFEPPITPKNAEKTKQYINSATFLANLKFS